MIKPEDKLTENEKMAMADTLGGRIVSAREAAGLTPQDVAKRAGVKLLTLQNWESDRSEPRSNKLFMLAGLLNVMPTWLLNGRGDAPDEELMMTDMTSMRDRLIDLRNQSEQLTEQLDAVIDSLSPKQS